MFAEGSIHTARVIHRISVCNDQVRIRQVDITSVPNAAAALIHKDVKLYLPRDCASVLDKIARNCNPIIWVFSEIDNSLPGEKKDRCLCIRPYNVNIYCDEIEKHVNECLSCKDVISHENPGQRKKEVDEMSRELHRERVEAKRAARQTVQLNLVAPVPVRPVVIRNLVHNMTVRRRVTNEDENIHHNIPDDDDVLMDLGITGVTDTGAAELNDDVEIIESKSTKKRDRVKMESRARDPEDTAGKVSDEEIETSNLDTTLSFAPSTKVRKQ